MHLHKRRPPIEASDQDQLKMDGSGRVTTLAAKYPPHPSDRLVILGFDI